LTMLETKWVTCIVPSMFSGAYPIPPKLNWNTAMKIRIYTKCAGSYLYSPKHVGNKLLVIWFFAYIQSYIVSMVLDMGVPLSAHSPSIYWFALGYKPPPMSLLIKVLIV
jgi:hypothetical protein